jgi:hypothetical protein
MIDYLAILSPTDGDGTRGNTSGKHHFKEADIALENRLQHQFQTTPISKTMPFHDWLLGVFFLSEVVERIVLGGDRFFFGHRRGWAWPPDVAGLKFAGPLKIDGIEVTATGNVTKGGR